MTSNRNTVRTENSSINRSVTTLSTRTKRTTSEPSQRAVERASDATLEPAGAPPPPTSTTNNKKKRSIDAAHASVERVAGDARADKKKTKTKRPQQQQVDTEKKEAKQERAISTRGSDDQEHDRLRRELLEVRGSLIALKANTRAKERARAAAADVVEMITVLLQQHPIINYSFGDILRSNCFWSEQDLLGKLELLDEELGERLGVWQWAWLHERGYVEQDPEEYIIWLMQFVPIEFADMCHGMARHYADDVPVRAPIGRNDNLGYDSATEDAADEASADTRKFVVADSGSAASPSQVTRHGRARVE